MFGRLDELAANVLHKRSIFSNGSMQGLDEVFLWLDAVAARKTAAPVLLMLSHADKVARDADRRAVSEAITEVLCQRDHPVAPRLIQPETGLLFYALDNRGGLQDPGVVAYRDKLQQLCEESESAKQRAPLELLRFLDAFNALQRKAQWTTRPQSPASAPCGGRRPMSPSSARPRRRSSSPPSRDGT